MEEKWNLDGIVKIKDWEKLYSDAEKEIEKAEKWVKRLKPDMKGKEFLELIDWSDEVEEKLKRLGYRVGLREEANQKDREAKLLKMRINDLGLRISKVSRKIIRWTAGLRVEGRKRLDKKNAIRLFRETGDLKYALERSRQGAKYSLEEREEEIGDYKDTYGLEVAIDLREMIETEMEYDFLGKRIKTQAELMKYVYSNKSDERQAAYRALFKEHKKQIDKFWLVYQAAARNWDYEAKIRGYKSPIAMRNWSNDVADEAVEVLLKVVSEKRGLFGKFFEIKAKMLGVKRLSRFDLYAPIKKRKEKEISWEEARKMVVESFYEFSDRFGKAAESIFKDKHVDSHPRVNKRSGAFCATITPKLSPYILLNYTGKTRDVYTLAHELGHGAHSIYASKHRLSVQQASLPLAETASTLAEMMVFEKLIKKANGEKRKEMIMEKLTDIYATVLRQNYFVKFEIESHKRFEKGMGVEEVSRLWLKSLEEQFGGKVEVEEIFGLEWSYIPHIINSPFYCYAYSFGELMALVLYKRYKENKKFAEKIEKILETGGAENPAKVLKRVGVDMTEENCWREGFEVIEELIGQL